MPTTVFIMKEDISLMSNRILQVFINFYADFPQDLDII
jgi:hypothetical protein